MRELPARVLEVDLAYQDVHQREQIQEQQTGEGRDGLAPNFETSG